MPKSWFISKSVDQESFIKLQLLEKINQIKRDYRMKESKSDIQINKPIIDWFCLKDDLLIIPKDYSWINKMNRINKRIIDNIKIIW